MRRLPVTLAACLALTAIGSPGGSLAQDAPATAAVTLAPVGGSGVTGLAVLTPRDGDTSANIVVVGAAAGAMAVIHAGTCGAIDPAPVGLLGDVGTSGQLSTAVPVSFPSVADGAHVIAIHPGIDLSTTVACGPIPHVASGAAAPTTPASTAPAPGTTGKPTPANHYQSPTFGFSIDWEDPWQRQTWDPGSGFEGLSLTRGGSSVAFVAFQHPDGNVTTCIRDWEGRLLELLRAGTVADLQPVTDATQPSATSSAERAVGSYQYLYKTQADPAGSTIVERDECRRLSGSAVIEITADVPAADRATAMPLVDDLVARLMLSAVPTSSGTPTMAPTAPPATAAPPTPQPTAAPTPEPTPDAACAGMQAWVADTLSRFDALKQMGDDLNAAMSAGMQAYAQQLGADSLAVQQLLIAQQGAAVPAAAKDIQPNLIRMFQKLADAYDLMSRAYTTGDSGLLQQGLSTAGEAQTLANTTRSSIRNAATPCGITVPAG